MIINMTHGNGGMETSKLINNIFMKYFKNPLSAPMNDSAVFEISGKAAFTTDSYVVQPLFFKGGDIGRLAVCGTVNDLLTAGAVPKYISAAFIIEEGTDTDTLEKIAASMQKAADEAGVLIVTGDTKVIEGNGGVYINTAGVGAIKNDPVGFSPSEGDTIIVTGTMGDHHACIMSYRMEIENSISSDAAPLKDIVMNLIDGKIKLKGIRDITRGGLGTVLNEVSAAAGIGAEVEELSIPISDQVAGLCKILGLDPMHMANEGKMLIVVPADEAIKALDIIKRSKYGENAAVIGTFTKEKGVRMKTRLGTHRVVRALSGGGLPRIC